MDIISFKNLSARKAEEKFLETPQGTLCFYQRTTTENLVNAIQWGVSILTLGKTFISDPMVKIIHDCALVMAFTTMDFVGFDTMSASEIYAHYDGLQELEIINTLKNQVDNRQIRFIEEGIDNTVSSIIKYQNSAAGVIEKIADDAKLNSAAMEEAMQTLNDTNNLSKVEHLATMIQKVASPQ